MPTLQTHTLVVMMPHRQGVLTRVTNLIRRQGINIQSVSVTPVLSPRPGCARLTLTLEATCGALPVLVERIQALTCVQSVTVCRAPQYAFYELLLLEILSGDQTAVDQLAKRLQLHCLSPGRLYQLVADPQTIASTIQAFEAIGNVLPHCSGVVAIPNPDQHKEDAHDCR